MKSANNNTTTINNDSYNNNNNNYKFWEFQWRDGGLTRQRIHIALSTLLMAIK